MNKRRKNESPAQSIVELAVMMPLMLLILLGTIDIGRMYADYVNLKSAVREGAGYGQTNPSDTAGMRSRALNAGVPSGTVVTASCAGDCTSINGSGKVVVTATSTFRPIMTGFFAQFGLGTITLSAEARMRAMT